MKKIIFLPFIVAVIFSLTGCGGSSSSSDDKTTNETIMNTNVEYAVKTGDKVVKLSNDAVIDVTRNSESSTSTVVLTSGEAKIVSN